MDDVVGQNFTIKDFNSFVGVNTGFAVAATLINVLLPKKFFLANLIGELRITLNSVAFSLWPPQASCVGPNNSYSYYLFHRNYIPISLQRIKNGKRIA
ncbi:MAG TPA: hypothetical protein DD706_13900 [Nitrospiraceae bacterium]|nr:hypothetical protein [Nitrospiraceae bacterium]